jgi:hypothetical protein
MEPAPSLGEGARPSRAEASLPQHAEGDERHRLDITVSFVRCLLRDRFTINISTGGRLIGGYGIEIVTVLPSSALSKYLSPHCRQVHLSH